MIFVIRMSAYIAVKLKTLFLPAHRHVGMNTKYVCVGWAFDRVIEVLPRDITPYWTVWI